MSEENKTISPNQKPDFAEWLLAFFDDAEYACDGDRDEDGDVYTSESFSPPGIEREYLSGIENILLPIARDYSFRVNSMLVVDSGVWHMPNTSQDTIKVLMQERREKMLVAIREYFSIGNVILALNGDGKRKNLVVQGTKCNLLGRDCTVVKNKDAEIANLRALLLAYGTCESCGNGPEPKENDRLCDGCYCLEDHGNSEWFPNDAIRNIKEMTR